MLDTDANDYFKNIPASVWTFSALKRELSTSSLVAYITVKPVYPFAISTTLGGDTLTQR